MVHAFHRLDAEGQTMVWAASDGALPLLLYWGEALGLEADLAVLQAAQRRALPHGGLDADESVSWLPEPGRGFTDMPGLELRRGDRLPCTRFVLRAAQRGHAGWVFEYEDADHALGLRLSLSVDPASGVFSAGLTLTNRGPEDLAVDRLISLALPVPAVLRGRIAFAGRWGGEFDITREPIGSAGWLQEARVGRSSHHAFPGVIVAEVGTDATRGEAWAVQLAWSGNHRLLLQRTRHGAAQLQAGELLLSGEVVLAPGEQVRTPMLHLARSGQGLRQLALRCHRFARRQVLPALGGPRPVQFSTWEATFFDHDEARQKRLADAAAALGVERFVLDDGWFIGRRDDRGGLGDWTPCPERCPQGLRALAERCTALGMQFGLWVEPEGVNADSALFRAHPDWIIGPPDRALGRHQYTLNFGLPAVRENLLAMPEGDRIGLRDAIAVYKAERGCLHASDVTPIDHADPAVHAVWDVAADRARALLAVAATERPRQATMAPIRLPGLAPDAHYRIALHPPWRPDARAGKTVSFLHAATQLVLDGRTLAQAGIALPILDPASCAPIVLQKVH